MKHIITLLFCLKNLEPQTNLSIIMSFTGISPYVQKMKKKHPRREDNGDLEDSVEGFIGYILSL